MGYYLLSSLWLKLPPAPSCYTLRITATRFEWDSEKNRANRTKHAGIDFENRIAGIADPNLILRKDRVVEGEQRWHGIGTVRKAVLLVVHVYFEETPNGEEVIRILPAREADPRERRVYLEQTPE
jgi:uncharacterized DUF497 family protein